MYDQTQVDEKEKKKKKYNKNQNFRLKQKFKLKIKNLKVQLRNKIAFIMTKNNMEFIIVRIGINKHKSLKRRNFGFINNKIMDKLI